MTVDSALPLPYAVTGISTLIGRVLTIDEWAAAAKIPARTGGVMSGELVERVLGIQGKSWDPWTFADLGRIAEIGRDALLSADLEPRDIDTMIVVTCSPYEIMLDQDAFRMARELQLPEERRDWSPQGILAFSKICTHAGCAVSEFRYPKFEPTAPSPAVVCPCHYSTFDVTKGGEVVFGPAGRPLPQLPIAIDQDGNLVAAGGLSGRAGPSWWGVRK
jgi:nitrite reductase/ring-hydroxylating ferredoxin subunit